MRLTWLTYKKRLNWVVRTCFSDVLSASANVVILEKALLKLHCGTQALGSVIWFRQCFFSGMPIAETDRTSGKGVLTTLSYF